MQLLSMQGVDLRLLGSHQLLTCVSPLNVSYKRILRLAYASWSFRDNHQGNLSLVRISAEQWQGKCSTDFSFSSVLQLWQKNIRIISRCCLKPSDFGSLNDYQFAYTLSYNLIVRAAFICPCWVGVQEFLRRIFQRNLSAEFSRESCP